mmetsp:Transcript_27592/g.64736  ORF Transcript_27592/g.64736 Transcript_27592/m.64736 type:complete len:915 (-) Transcript_27592:232-2976(-)
MTGYRNHGERKENEEEEEEDEDDDDFSAPNLYSLLNLRRDATTDEVHRSYRSLSTTFHPDKVRLRRRTPDAEQNEQELEEIQETFLQFKKAHDVLIDPVLRLAYDCYGEDGVELIRKVQQQQRDEKTRREEAAREEEDDGRGDTRSGGFDDYDDDGGEDDDSAYDDDDDDDDAYNLYERLEHLLLVQANIPKAKTELRKFMEQHDYLRNLTEDNCVHLNLSMTFPPVVPLKPVLYRGRDYLRFVQKSLLAKPPADEEEKQYYKQRILQERRLVDYQISQLRSSQKADVGFSLSSVVPPPSRNGSRNNQGNNPIRYQPSKWSMAVGCSTDVVYPGSAELARMAAAARDPKSKDYQAVAEKHPVTMFVNTSYHAAPTTQIFATANLNNDNETHQYSLGSTHTFANQTACRYGMTILNRSPLPDNDPVIFNLKTYRHLQGIGTTAVGISAGSNGRMLQWNASWQATLSSLFSRRSNNTQQQQQQQRQQQASQQHFSHKVSAKASLGMLQGNSLEFGYKCKFPKRDEDGEKRNDQEPSSSSSSSSLWSWLEDNFNLPKKAELTAVWGTFSKLTAIVTHEITSLATHPTLGFGLEHDISLGRWAWIWELHYNQSTFRIPISVVQLGSLTNYRAFYTQKLYYGMYCMFLQSIVTDLLEELGGSDRKSSGPTSHASHSHSGSEAGHASELVSRNRKGFPLAKTKLEAEHQLALMKTVAEAKRYRETQRQASDGNGLIILTATYWHRLRHNSSELDDNEEEEEDQDPSSWVYEVVSMDATIQLQYWVKDGRFSAPGGIPKSSWMGFYTLATESKFRKGRRRHRKHITGAKRWLLFGKRRVQRVWNEWWKTMAGQAENDTGDNNLSRSDNDQEEQGPQLTVRYSYDGNVYEVTVGEKEALALPFEDRSDGDRLEVLGDAEFVQ